MDMELSAFVLESQLHKLSMQLHSKVKAETSVAFRGALGTARPTYTLESFDAMGFSYTKVGRGVLTAPGIKQTSLFPRTAHLLKSPRKTVSNGTSSKHTL